MRNFSNVTLMALIFVVTGCAGIIADPNTLLVDFVCDPEGATLYQNQAENASPTVSENTCPTTFLACRSPYVARTLGPPQTLAPAGICPVTLQYKITDQDRARGYVMLRGVTAYWVSGATSSVNSINANLQNGLHQNFHFERPRSFPAYDVDANYALNLEKTRILKQQAEEQESQAAIATFNNAVAAANAAYANAPPPPAITHTNCYTLANTLHCTNTPY